MGSTTSGSTTVDGVLEQTEILEVYEQPDIGADREQKDRFGQPFARCRPCLLHTERAEKVHARGEQEDKDVLRDKGHIKVQARGKEKISPESLGQGKVAEDDKREKQKKFHGIE